MDKAYNIEGFGRLFLSLRPKRSVTNEVKYGFSSGNPRTRVYNQRHQWQHGVARKFFGQDGNFVLLP
jgi:hypothetical protein